MTGSAVPTISGPPAGGLINAFQTTHGFAVGDVIKHASNVYSKAKADTPANAEAVGIVSAVIDANNFTYIPSGMISTLSGLTADTVYFLSDVTAGLLTATEPTTVGSVSKPMLIGLTTTAGIVVGMRGSVISLPGMIGTLASSKLKLTSGDMGSITGTSFVDITGASITMTTGARRVKVTASGAWVNNTLNAYTCLELLVDGVAQGGTHGLHFFRQIGASGQQDSPLSISYTTDVLAAGSHTFKLQVRVTAGTGTVFKSAISPLVFSVEEVADSIGGGNLDGWVDDSAETWTYISADAPTFVFSVNGDVTGKYSPGQRIKLTQTTAKYFIITAVGAYGSGVTNITVYGGTDYTLANAAITLPFHSREKAPVGFPLSPTKWTVELNDTSNRTQGNPATNTLYNVAALDFVIPIGIWNVSYEGELYYTRSSGSASEMHLAFSTTNNSISDPNLQAVVYDAAAAGVQKTFHFDKVLTLAAKTTYYTNIKTTIGGTGTWSINLQGTDTPTRIRAVCAYL